MRKIALILLAVTSLSLIAAPARASRDSTEQWYGRKCYSYADSGSYEDVAMLINRSDIQPSLIQGLLQYGLEACGSGRTGAQYLHLQKIEVFRNGSRVGITTFNQDVGDTGFRSSAWFSCTSGAHNWYAKATFNIRWPDGSYPQKGPVSLTSTISC